MRTRFGERRSLLAGALFVVGCAGGTEPVRQATQLIQSGGDGQSWYFDNALPLPYTVTALDDANRPVAGVIVSWSVTSGGGSLDPVQSTTDTAGTASSVHTLGPSAPAQSVTASSGTPGPPAVLFTATAAAPPTAVAVTVRDDFFDQASVAVQVNGTVTWTWAGANPHSVTFGTGTPTSATQDRGSYALTFSTPGVFNYFCKVHGGMKGTVTVVR